MVLASEHSLLPANLHFHNPNADIPALHDGRIQVVTDTTKWDGPRAGLNSFGFGGANVHTILERNKKEKKPLPKTPTLLVVSSGRTKEWVSGMLTLVQEHPNDIELQALLDAQVNLSMKTHPARGYSLLTHKQQSEVVVR